jgi:hypothetical protein
MIVDNLAVPFQTMVLGVDVTVEDVDLTGRGEIVAHCFPRSVPADDLDPRPSPARASTRGCGVDRRVPPLGGLNTIDHQDDVIPDQRA